MTIQTRNHWDLLKVDYIKAIKEATEFQGDDIDPEEMGHKTDKQMVEGMQAPHSYLYV